MQDLHYNYIIEKLETMFLSLPHLFPCFTLLPNSFLLFCFPSLLSSVLHQHVHGASSCVYECSQAWLFKTHGNAQSDLELNPSHI